MTKNLEELYKSLLSVVQVKDKLFFDGKVISIIFHNNYKIEIVGEGVFKQYINSNLLSCTRRSTVGRVIDFASS
jgi:hypothetical protein